MRLVSLYRVLKFNPDPLNPTFRAQVRFRFYKNTKWPRPHFVAVAVVLLLVDVGVAVEEDRNGLVGAGQVDLLIEVVVHLVHLFRPDLEREVGEVPELPGRDGHRRREHGPVDSRFLATWKRAMSSFRGPYNKTLQISFFIKVESTLKHFFRKYGVIIFPLLNEEPL